MTARFRSAFFGSSGFVAVRPEARVIAGAGAADRREQRIPTQSYAVPAGRTQAKAA